MNDKELIVDIDLKTNKALHDSVTPDTYKYLFQKGYKEGRADEREKTAKKIFRDLENLHKKIQDEPIIMVNPLNDKHEITAISEYWDLKKKWINKKALINLRDFKQKMEKC